MNQIGRQLQRFIILLLNIQIDFFSMNIYRYRSINPDLNLIPFNRQHLDFDVFTDLDRFMAFSCEYKHHFSPFIFRVSTSVMGALTENAASFKIYCLPIFVRELIITGARKLRVLCSKGSVKVTIAKTTISCSCSMAKLSTICSSRWNV